MNPTTIGVMLLSVLAVAGDGRLARSATSTVVALSGQEAQPITVTRSGTQPARSGPGENFTGAVRVEPLFTAIEPSHAASSYVTFQPGARTAWHTHPRGQVLVVTAGVGRVQGWGGPVEEMRVGDVVRIRPNQKHWHGASPDSTMTHMAIQEHLNGVVVSWMEKVTDEQYAAAPKTVPPSASQ